MDKKILVVFIFVILGLAVLTYGYTQQGPNTTQNGTIQNVTQNNTVQSSEEQTDTNGTAKDYDVIIIQKGPSNPQKRGTSVPIQYTITNEGKNTIYGVKVWSQDFGRDIGTLKPGKTKKYTYLSYIPTSKDLTSDMGENVKLNSPLVIGGIELSFTDDNGAVHRVQSNSIEIKLLN